MLPGKPKQVMVIAATLMVLATVYVFTSSPSGPSSGESAIQGAGGLPASAPSTLPGQPGTTAQPPITGEDEAHMMAGFFRQEYGARIHNPYWQLKMLERLMLLLKQKYPQDWEAKLREVLMLAFPDLAEMLLKKLSAFNEYSEWIGSLKGNMTFNDDAERRKAMWDKRVALFGDEAYVIWEAQYKNEQFADRLVNLEQSSAGFAEKSGQYINAMKEVFGPQALEGGHTTQKMGRFLELPSVQTELAQMPAAQRREQLREFRSAMGLDEEALQRWDALDAERDQIRAAGMNYMQQREQLTQQYQGAELEQKLSALQDQAFGPVEAKYIRNEEASGYFRFDTPQKIGFN